MSSELPLPLKIMFNQEGNLLYAKPFPAFPTWTLIYTGSGGGASVATGYGSLFADEFLSGGIGVRTEILSPDIPYGLLVDFQGVSALAAAFINLRDGLYRVTARLARGSTLGIVSLSMNSVDFATGVDLYSEAADFNYIVTYEDVPVLVSGDQVFAFAVTDKNELSSNYGVAIIKVNFWRTGDLP